MSSTWSEFEHISDIGIFVKAESVEQLFRTAATGMMNLMTDTPVDGPQVTETVTVEGPDLETLLVVWLEEILYLFEVKNLVPLKSGPVSLGNNRASGEIECEEFDNCKHTVRHCIKAVTWHDLKITEEKGTYMLKIIFDV